MLTMLALIPAAFFFAIRKAYRRAEDLAESQADGGSAELNSRP
ncbi:MAG: hypothetical protein ACI8QS_000517 [Planctomycetota bacterium]|jgi:hypothetical protein